MEFINYIQYIQDIKNWIDKLPKDFDLIVAVPRSGLIPASMISLRLNIPLTTRELFLKNEFFSKGRRGDFNDKNILKVLVVDDSLYSGSEIQKTKQMLENLDYEIKYSVVYCSPGKETLIDHFYKIIEVPRIFEWNLAHHAHLRKACLDLDGVLCVDPEEEENDDGERYINFIKDAKLLWRPSLKVKYIVSSRLEKYRKETEKWLNQHKIEYEKLFLLDCPDMETRKRLKPHAKFKSKVYQESDCRIFIESSEWQAKEIAANTKKPVLCFDNMELHK